MSNITIEMVDAVMSRVKNANYDDVKNALIESDGDIVNAIIILENKSKKNLFIQNKEDLDEIVLKINQGSEKIKEKIIDFMETAKNVRLVVESKNKVILNIPIAVGLGAFAMVPVFTLIGLSGAVLTNCTVKVQDEDTDKSIEFGIFTPSDMEVLTNIISNTLNDLKNGLDLKKNKNEEIVDVEYVFKSNVDINSSELSNSDNVIKNEKLFKDELDVTDELLDEEQK